MQVVHEIKSDLLRNGQHVALVKDTQNLNGYAEEMWGISLDAAPGGGVHIICAGLNEAANLFHLIEQGFKNGTIVGIEAD